MADLIVFGAGFTVGFITCCKFFGWYHRRYGYWEYRRAWDGDVQEDDNQGTNRH